MTEIAIRTNSDLDWRELDKTLYDLQNTAFPQINRRSRDSDRDANYESQLSSADRLIKISSGFRCAGRPEVAKILLEKAMQKLKPNFWQNPRAELVLCLIDLKDYPTASKTYNELIGTIPDMHWNDKLVQIADAYISQNQKNSAESVVNYLVRRLQDSKTVYERPRLLSILGSLEFRLGSYVKAEKYFREASKGTEEEQRSRSTITSPDFGAVLEREGKVNEAIREYLNAAISENSNNFTGTGPLNISLSKALKLLSQTENVPSDVLTLLSQALQRSSAEEESSLVSEQLIQVAKKQSANIPDLKTLQTVRTIFEHEKQLELAASLKVSPTKVNTAEPASTQALPQTNSAPSSTTIAAPVSKRTGATTAAIDTPTNVIDLQNDRDHIALEIQNKNFDKAADYVIVLIQDDAKNPQSQLMNHPGNRIGDLCLKAFEDAGRLDLAEKVLKAAIEIEPLRKPYDGGVLNRALLVHEYAKDHKSADALALAEVVLSQFEKYPDQIVVNKSRSCSSSLSVLFWAVESLANTKDFESAERLNQRLSDFFKRMLVQRMRYLLTF